MMIYFFISVQKVHETVTMVVIMRTFGCIHGDLHVIWAEPVALCVCICKRSSLKHFVVGIVYSRNDGTRIECQHFVLIEEVVNILVQNQPTHRLHNNIIPQKSIHHKLVINHFNISECLSFL